VRAHTRTHTYTHTNKQTNTQLIRQAISASVKINRKPFFYLFSISSTSICESNSVYSIDLRSHESPRDTILFPRRRCVVQRDHTWQFTAWVWSSPLESPWTRPVLWRTSADSACRVEISTIFSVAGLATVKVLPCRSGTAIFQNRCDDCVRPQPTHFAAGRCTGGRFPRSSHLRPSSARQPWKKVQFPNKCTG